MTMIPPRSWPHAALKKRIERLASRRCATPLATGLERVMDAGEQCDLIAIARYTRREQRRICPRAGALVQRIHIHLRHLREQIDVTNLELRITSACECCCGCTARDPVIRHHLPR